MAFCLLPNKVEEFKKALKEKEINISDLLHMTSEARIELLKKYAGENAKNVNTLFEEKLVLKNKIQGIKNWASKMGEIGRYDPKKKAKIDSAISEYRAKQMERIFNPKEEEAFLSNLAEKKLGVEITREEAKRIFDLTAEADKLKGDYDAIKETWKSEKSRVEYGASQVILENYVRELKGEDLPIKQSLPARISQFKQEYAENKPKAIASLLGDILKKISDTSIALTASVDNSFLGRQGINTLKTHPSAWWDGAKNSFIDFYKTMGGKETMDALMADVYSRPNFLNGKYQEAGIIKGGEEQFPTSLPERVPYLGRIFKASEVAFKGSGIRMRTDLFDLLDKKAQENGVEMDSVQVKDIGKLVNSLTARGKWGKTGEPTIVKLILWSPRMLKANIDVLTAHGLGSGLETKFARKEAATNLAKIIGTSAALIMIANAIKPGSAETDPRSSNFGKIKIGNTTFDFTGGAGSLIVLASRIVTNSSKSATTNIVTPYGTGYGQQNSFDAFIDFLVGKTTPAVGAMIELAKGKTFQGEKPTIESTLLRTQVPISIQNAIQLKDNASADAILGVMSDLIGISSRTSIPETDWSQNSGAELNQFKEKIGDQKFQEANDKFNQRYNDWFKTLENNDEYQVLTDEDKKKELTKKKDEIKNQIFKEYGFKYQKK